MSEAVFRQGATTYRRSPAGHSLTAAEQEIVARAVSAEPVMRAYATWTDDAEPEEGFLFGFDFDESVEHHRAAVVVERIVDALDEAFGEYRNRGGILLDSLERLRPGARQEFIEASELVYER